jgi:hypothetical protein
LVILTGNGLIFDKMAANYRDKRRPSAATLEIISRRELHQTPPPPFLFVHYLYNVTNAT